MGANHRWGFNNVAPGLPSLLRTVALLSAAAATAAVVTVAAELTSVASSGAAAQSAVMPQDGNVRLHRSTPLNLVARQPLDGFEPSAIRRLQRQRRRSQNVAVSAGLAAVVCLAVAFVVFQCARKALFPRLFGSPGKRALSDSDLEDQWVSVCVEEEIDESDESSGGAEARPTEEAGEATALEALGELRSLLTLGVQTASQVPLERRAALVVLLLTICTQELALHGVYSTPRTEVERQMTIDFVLAVGQQALSQLEAECPADSKTQRGRDFLYLLERFREAPANADSGGLAVEATISGYRIKQCSYALQQLQPWVQSFTPIPVAVVDAAVKLVARVRHTGKRRLTQDPTASVWVDAMQAAHGFFGIAKPGGIEGTGRLPLPLAEELNGRCQMYERFSRALTKSIDIALGHRGPRHQRMQGRSHQQRQQQQLQGQEQLQQQQHPAPRNKSGNIAGPRLLRRQGQQPVSLTLGGGVISSHPSSPSPGARRRSSSATTSSSLRPPTLQSTHHHRTDTLQDIAQPERRGQPAPWSAPSRQRLLQETKEQQPSLDSSTVHSVLRAEAPEFRPRQPPAPGAQQHVALTPLDASGSWATASPTPGFALLRQPAYPSTAEHSDSASPPHSWVETVRHAVHPLTLFPQPAPAPHTLTPVEHLQSDPQALPGPSDYPPDPLMPTGELSPVFPGPMLQPPPPEISQQGFTHPHALPGGWQHIPARLVLASPGALQSSGVDISLDMIGPAPPGPVTAEAVSTPDGTWTGGAERGHPGEEQWQFLPPSHPSPD